MTIKQARLITLLCFAAFILAFLISARFWVRLDLTRNKAYTISEVSRNLGKDIEDEVTITYFISARLESIHPMPAEIADLLREYAAHSRGKIRFVERDPEKAGLLQKVEELGIIPQQIQVVEKNEATYATVYTGILIEYLDREEVIPVVFSLDTLEYDISSRIRSLVINTEKVLGIMVADSYKQWQNEYGILNQELILSGFKVRLINPGDEIPAMLSALFVFGGAEDLDDSDLTLIDRFITEGGRVLFAVDGVIVDTRGSLEAHAVSDKGLLAMLANYGVVVQCALIQDITALNLTFQAQSGNGTYIRSLRYPQWISVQEEAGNKEHPVTARFGGLDLYWASPLELFPPPGVKGDILFTSTDRAWLQTENFVTNPNLISEFASEAAETMGTRVLGVSLQGVFPSAYEEPAFPYPKKESRIIVIGDTDFAGNFMQTNRGGERNLDFLIRASEWLLNDDDIINIRNRETSGGRLDRISDPEERKLIMSFSRNINTIIIPLLVIIAGIFFGWKRAGRMLKHTGRKERTFDI